MASSNIKAVILGGLQQVWELILDIENLRYLEKRSK